MWEKTAAVKRFKERTVALESIDISVCNIAAVGKDINIAVPVVNVDAFDNCTTQLGRYILQERSCIQLVSLGIVGKEFVCGDIISPVCRFAVYQVDDPVMFGKVVGVCDTFYCTVRLDTLEDLGGIGMHPRSLPMR